MTIDGKNRDGKLQYDLNREAAKISSLSSGKIDKYEYLTGERILPSNQRRLVEQAKFTYSLLGKALGKQRKTIGEEAKKKQQQEELSKVLKPNTQKLKLKGVIPENTLGEEAEIEFNKNKEIEKTVERKSYADIANAFTYSFKNFRTIDTCHRDIYNGKIPLKVVDEDQRSLLVKIMN